LIRPARWGVVELTAPFTAQRFLNQVRGLCSLTDKDWVIRVFPTETAWNNNEFFKVARNVESDIDAMRAFENEFGRKIVQDSHVYIYKELVRCHRPSKIRETPY